MRTSEPYKQPWIGKPFTEVCFILLPPFASLLFIVLFPQFFQDNSDMPAAWWVLLILLVDVAHVYSTLYKTYFDKDAVAKQNLLFKVVPFVAFIATVLMYSVSPFWFWRVLAYLAVYHFIRQQYGFMRIYSRKETYSKRYKQFDKFVIYYATLYPILYWHLHPDRNFNWFTEGDFWQVPSALLLRVTSTIYAVIVVCFISKEIYVAITYRFINIPRITIVAGTLLSWYFGIVYFNGDMAFTLLNVVSHGIPYMALVWLTGTAAKEERKGVLKVVYGRFGILIFLGIIFLLAYVEEGLWDSFLWREHHSVFSPFYISSVAVSSPLLNILVPLLALPQITHYILDGFIWKGKHNVPAYDVATKKPSQAMALYQE